ncbi:MAG: baseplate J/gp47 family protein [Hyphomicrobium sp.]|uniref:baseplate J/gp47 family protein n=1 Tax=Hyphomicrobium sp. TaxID=82 RepID=UPI003D134B80
MPWPTLTLRDRRKQVRDDIATHLPGADATVPNSVLRVIADAMAGLVYDNDLHIDWVVRMMMPDTAEGEFADRWANIWLPQGRKGASYAAGELTVTGSIGAAVPTGARLTTTVIDDAGENVGIEFEVVAGITLSSTSGVVEIAALTPGAAANLDEGAFLSFVTPPGGIDGTAVVAAPGCAGGAEIESDADLIERYIARIQQPPQGGARHDYIAWALEVPGVTRAWATQEMGVGTVTVRFMMDDVRADDDGLPEEEDIDLVAEHLDPLRPVTVADMFVLAPVRQDETVEVTLLSRDTPEVRANIVFEVATMLRARAKPGQTIYASWVREAISAATGEDYHDTEVSNLVPESPGHMIFIDIEFGE